MLHTEKFDFMVYKRIKLLFLFLTFIFFIIMFLIKDIFWIDFFIRKYIANTFIISLIISGILIILGLIKLNKGITSYFLIIISYFMLSWIWLWSIIIIVLNWNLLVSLIVLLANFMFGIGLIPISLFILLISNQNGLFYLLCIFLIVRLLIWFIGYKFRQHQLKPLKNNEV
jgi:hypothetical protein